MTLTSAGQSLLDLALQEGGSLEALFALQDAYNAQYPDEKDRLALTDLPPPGVAFEPPAPVNTDLADYFAARRYRISTGDAGPRPGTAPVPVAVSLTDFSAADFSAVDFK
jgi:hypothetical protein